MKRLSNRYWGIHGIDTNVYGYEMKGKVKWKPGLSDEELKEFENAMGFSFPTPLRNFYKTMNGLNKQGVYYDEDGNASYFPFYYSYPDDLARIKNTINWIYKETKMTEEKIREEGISRIFPIQSHRFIMIDIPTHPILSMFGSDIIFWSENLSQLVALDVFPQLHSKKGFNRFTNKVKVDFWIEEEKKWKAWEAAIPDWLSKGTMLHTSFRKEFGKGEYYYRVTLVYCDEIYKLTLNKVFVDKKGNSDDNWLLEKEPTFADYDTLKQYVQDELNLAMHQFYRMP